MEQRTKEQIGLYTFSFCFKTSKLPSNMIEDIKNCLCNPPVDEYKKMERTIYLYRWLGS